MSINALNVVKLPKTSYQLKSEKQSLPAANVEMFWLESVQLPCQFFVVVDFTAPIMVKLKRDKR